MWRKNNKIIHMITTHSQQISNEVNKQKNRNADLADLADEADF